MSDHSRIVSLNILRRFSDRLVKDTSGVAAIEFAILVPILTLMVIAISDIGFAVYREIQVEDAAQAGAQWAIRNGFDSNGISNAVVSATNPSITAIPAPRQFCGCATGSSVSLATCGTSCPGGLTAGTYTTVSSQLAFGSNLGCDVYNEISEINPLMRFGNDDAFCDTILHPAIELV